MNQTLKKSLQTPHKNEILPETIIEESFNYECLNENKLDPSIMSKESTVADMTPIIENILKSYSPAKQVLLEDQDSNNCAIRLHFDTSIKKSPLINLQTSPDVDVYGIHLVTPSNNIGVNLVNKSQLRMMDSQGENEALLEQKIADSKICGIQLSEEDSLLLQSSSSESYIVNSDNKKLISSMNQHHLYAPVGNDDINSINILREYEQFNMNKLLNSDKESLSLPGNTYENNQSMMSFKQQEDSNMKNLKPLNIFNNMQFNKISQHPLEVEKENIAPLKQDKIYKKSCTHSNKDSISSSLLYSENDSKIIKDTQNFEEVQVFQIKQIINDPSRIPLKPLIMQDLIPISIKRAGENSTTTLDAQNDIYHQFEKESALKVSQNDIKNIDNLAFILNNEYEKEKNKRDNEKNNIKNLFGEDKSKLEKSFENVSKNFEKENEAQIDKIYSNPGHDFQYQKENIATLSQNLSFPDSKNEIIPEISSIEFRKENLPENIMLNIELGQKEHSPDHMSIQEIQNKNIKNKNSLNKKSFSQENLVKFSANHQNNGFMSTTLNKNFPLLTNENLHSKEGSPNYATQIIPSHMINSQIMQAPLQNNNTHPDMFINIPTKGLISFPLLLHQTFGQAPNPYLGVGLANSRNPFDILPNQYTLDKKPTPIQQSTFLQKATPIQNPIENMNLNLGQLSYMNSGHTSNIILSQSNMQMTNLMILSGQKKKKKTKKEKQAALALVQQNIQIKAKSLQIDENYKPSLKTLKMLDQPLSEITQASSSPVRGMNSFLDRGNSMRSMAIDSGMKNKNEKREEKRESPVIKYYSDVLELDKEYKEKKETPISKTYKKSLTNANELQSKIQESIRNFTQSLNLAKVKFFEIQPQLDAEKLMENSPNGLNIDEARNKISIKKTPIYNKLLKRSITKSSRPFKPSVPKINQEEESCCTLGNILQDLCAESEETKNCSSDDIIKQRMKEEYGHCELEYEHSEIIKKIVNHQSCIYRYSNLSAKSLIYQLSAVFAEGLVIFINQSITYMADQIQNLPKSLSGACVNSLLSKEKIVQIFDLVKSRQVKILYITPDKLISENLTDLPEVSFVCIDEVQCLSEFSSNFKQSYQNLHKNIINKCKTDTILSFISPTTYQTTIDICQTLKLPLDSIHPLEYISNERHNLTISRDEDKNKALLSLLKSPKYKSITTAMIIYCDGRKTVDDLAALLSVNGLKISTYHNGKTEFQKLEILNNFCRNYGGIIITISNIDTGIDKNLIKCVIHYSMPKSFELYIQEISNINENAQCHMFLNDEDYFKMRLNIYSDMVERYQINKFIEKLYEAKHFTKETIQLSKDVKAKKRSSICALNSDFNPFLNKILKTNQNNNTEKMENENDQHDQDEVYSIKVNQLCKDFDLKKDSIVDLFEKFEKSCDWLEYLGTNPINCTVRFLQNKPENLALKSSLVKAILERNRKINGICKFSVIDIANELKITTIEIAKMLKGYTHSYETST